MRRRVHAAELLCVHALGHDLTSVQLESQEKVSLQGLLSTLSGSGFFLHAIPFHATTGACQGNRKFATELNHQKPGKMTPARFMGRKRSDVIKCLRLRKSTLLCLRFDSLPCFPSLSAIPGLIITRSGTAMAPCKFIRFKGRGRRQSNARKGFSSR